MLYNKKQTLSFKGYDVKSTRVGWLVKSKNGEKLVRIEKLEHDFLVHNLYKPCTDPEKWNTLERAKNSTRAILKQYERETDPSF